MKQEDMLVLEAQDVTASVVCICVLIACTVAAFFFFPRPRFNIVSHFVQSEMPIVPELAMVGARNPFTVKISNANLASIKDGIKLIVKTSVHSELQVLWVVDCSSLQRSASTWQHPVTPRCFETSTRSLLASSSYESLDAEIQTEIKLMLPETVTDTQIQDSMGPPPRTKYPLCLILRSIEEDSQVIPQPQIVGALHIIHIPDDTFRDRCRLISQLIISHTGQVWDVQQLFMATEGHTASQNASSIRRSVTSTPNVADSTGMNGQRTHSGCHGDNTDMNDATLDACVVCQNGIVSIALLPCRHTCVCTTCFPLLNRCPMCRGYIESFFPVDCGIDSDWERTNYAGNEDEDDDWATKFNNTCERLNQWLGLHDL